MLAQIKRDIMSKMYNYIDFTNYVVDFKSVESNFNKFKIKMAHVEFIEENDKIGFDENDILYINKQSTLQPIIRWLYSQNREGSINKLSEIFSEYSKLLQMIKISMVHSKNNTDELVDLVNDISVFNKKMLSGLDNLYKTYSTDDIYGKLIKDMLNSLCNFEKNTAY
jgi:ferritin